ncbi:hypothetical protein, partial [Alistipes communis]|uniref:hypothetical protein n=1 Tax=Alistipes communis TaxID=2585118 RepID=UPI003AB191A5
KHRKRILREEKFFDRFFGKHPDLRLGVSCEERIYHLLSPKGGAKSVRRAPSSGSDGGSH